VIELAIAFRLDFIGTGKTLILGWSSDHKVFAGFDYRRTYVKYLEALHDTGHVPTEVHLLERIAEDPIHVAEEETVDEIAAPRQTAITQTRRALRALDFSERVFAAYGDRCAICGIQLRLLEGAPILPAAEPGSTHKVVG
jgi:putative restriction endonuclease